MFDEMSIRENLHFNQKFGCIDGFEDLEAMAGQAVLQIMPWSSCSVTYVRGGSNQ